LTTIVIVGFTPPSRGPALLAARGRTMNIVASNRIDKLIQSISVLIVEDNQYMRKVIRNILVNIGV
jgi:hypothetical protein